MVFELRTYVAPPGRMPALLGRFRDHTLKLFEKHGMRNVGYWVRQDQPDTLVYLVSHDSREAAAANWDGFRADPEWQRVRDASEVSGKLVERIESVFLDSVDFSPIR